jgi:hypothetical protein
MLAAFCGRCRVDGNVIQYKNPKKGKKCCNLIKNPKQRRRFAWNLAFKLLLDALEVTLSPKYLPLPVHAMLIAV